MDIIKIVLKFRGKNRNLCIGEFLVNMNLEKVFYDIL